MRSKLKLSTILCLVVFLYQTSQAQVDFAGFYERGIFKLKNKDNDAILETILIKLDATRGHFELHGKSSTTAWSHLCNLHSIDLGNYLPSYLNNELLVCNKKTYALAYNQEKKEMWLYDLKRKTVKIYKEWFDEVFEMKGAKEGECKIAKIDEKSFCFRIEVYIENGHTGNLEGIAQKQGIDQYLFHDFDFETAKRYNMEDEPYQCRLVFNFLNKRKLKIEEQNCGNYHGVGIMFDGDYRK